MQISDGQVGVPDHGFSVLRSTGARAKDIVWDDWNSDSSPIAGGVTIMTEPFTPGYCLPFWRGTQRSLPSCCMVKARQQGFGESSVGACLRSQAPVTTRSLHREDRDIGAAGAACLLSSRRSQVSNGHRIVLTTSKGLPAGMLRWQPRSLTCHSCRNVTRRRCQIENRFGEVCAAGSSFRLW